MAVQLLIKDPKVDVNLAKQKGANLSFLNNTWITIYPFVNYTWITIYLFSTTHEAQSIFSQLHMEHNLSFSQSHMDNVLQGCFSPCWSDRHFRSGNTHCRNSDISNCAGYCKTALHLACDQEMTKITKQTLEALFSRANTDLDARD